MIKIEKYHKKYVELALACGSYGWGKIIYSPESTFLIKSVMNPPNTRIYGIDNFANYLRNVKKGKFKNWHLKRDIMDINPEQITRVNDITDFIKRFYDIDIDSIKDSIENEEIEARIKN